MASCSKENDSKRRRRGYPRVRGLKRKLFNKETKRLVDRLSDISGQEWVDAIANYASENELHLQVFPERDALHKKIISQCGSELGSFFKDLVKKYLELYASEWGASAALVFRFIGYVGRTLSGETKSSDLWSSVIEGEDKETARHIGNMYGLALMQQVDKIIEKQKRTGTAEDEAFCQSTEPDDYTCVSLKPKNIVIPRRRRIPKESELHPSQSYTEAVTCDTSLIKASTQTTKNCLNDATDGTSKGRHIPSVLKKSPECIKSTESGLPTSPPSSVLDTCSSVVPSTSSAIGSFPDKNDTLVSGAAPDTTATCLTYVISSNLFSPTTPTVVDSSTTCITSTTEKTSTSVASVSPSRKCIPLPTTGPSTECVPSRVTRTSTRCTTTPVTKVSTRHTISTAANTPVHIASSDSKASTRQKTSTQHVTSVEGTTSAVPEPPIKRMNRTLQRPSTKRKTCTSPVNSTRSGRVPKKKVVLDL